MLINGVGGPVGIKQRRARRQRRADIVAAEITTESPDFGHLEPMGRATQRGLAARRSSSRHTLGFGDPAVVLADAG
jgi:hypothetical protein